MLQLQFVHISEIRHLLSNNTAAAQSVSMLAFQIGTPRPGNTAEARENVSDPATCLWIRCSVFAKATSSLGMVSATNAE